MRILHDYVIIQILILMSLILTLTVINIYIFIRLKRTKITIGIHLWSMFILAFLLCVFLQVSAIDLKVEQYYRIGSGFFGLISLILTLFLTVIIMKSKSKWNKLQLIPPDLPNLLKEIDDHIMIFDHEGMLNYQNHPLQLNEILGKDNVKLYEVSDIILQQSSEALHKDIVIAFRDRSKLDCEVYFSNTNQYFLLKTAPVLAGRKNLVAFIILLHDVSSEKTLSMEIEKKNKNLEDVNRQLISYVEVAQVLEAERERLKLLESIQNDLMDKINLIIIELKQIYHREYSSATDFQRDIFPITEKLRNLYRVIRSTIQNIYERRE